MSYKLVGYFENWAQWREQRRSGWGFKPNQIDPFLYTHINYAFVTFGFISPGVEPDNPRPSGDYKVRPYEWNDESELFPALQALKKTNPALKTLLSFGGWNFNLKTHKDQKGHPIGIMTYQLFSKMVENPKHRQEFISSAIDYAREHGFDGVDIDWEYPGAAGQGDKDRGGRVQDFPNFVDLLKEFRNVAGNNFILTIAGSAIVPSEVPEDSEYKNPKRYFTWLAECAKYLDWINVMTYDYHGAWDTYTGVLAPLLEDSDPGGSYSVRDTIENYLEAFQAAGIPSEKIVLGIPTYGRTFKIPDIQTYPDKEPGKFVPGETIQERQGNAGVVTGEAGFLTYPEILERFSNNELRKWHEPTLTPYAFNYGEWVSYENEESVGYKASYLIEKELGGGMVWGISEDDFKNGFPLQKRIKAILNNPTTRPTLPQFEAPSALPESLRKIIPFLEDLGKKVSDSARKIEQGEDTKSILNKLFPLDKIETLEKSIEDSTELFGNEPDSQILNIWKQAKENINEIVDKLEKYDRQKDDNYLASLDMKTQELIEFLKHKLDEEAEFQLRESAAERDIRECRDNAICNMFLWIVRKYSYGLSELFFSLIKSKPMIRMRWEFCILYQILINIHIQIKMEKFESDRLRNHEEKCEFNSNDLQDTTQKYLAQLTDIKNKWTKYINSISTVSSLDTSNGIDIEGNKKIIGYSFIYKRYSINLKTSYVPINESEKLNEVEANFNKIRLADMKFMTNAVLGLTDEVFS